MRNRPAIELAPASAARRWIVAAILCAALFLKFGAGTASAMDCRTLFSPEAPLGTWEALDGSIVTSLPCEPYQTEYSLFSGYAESIRIFVPDWWERSPHPGAPADTPQLLAEAAAETVDILEPYMTPLPIRVVLLDTLYNQTPGGGALHERAGGLNVVAVADTVRVYNTGECPVAVFINGVVGQSPEDIKATVAHEIFHCFQMNDYPQRALRTTENMWWVEGTASRFENYLYACLNNERDKLAPAFNPEQSLIRQNPTHADVLFFAYLEQEFDHRLTDLVNFMGHMATSGGERWQFSAFSSYPSVDDIMDKFARRYIDGDIADLDLDRDPRVCTGQFSLPEITPSQEIVLSARKETVEVTVDPFQIGFIKVDFAGKRYKTRIVGDGPQTVSIRPEGSPGAWTRVGSEASDAGGGEDDCGNEGIQLLAITATPPESSAQKVTLEFERPDDEPDSSRVSVASLCGAGMSSRNRNDCRDCKNMENFDPGETDRCLIGRWRLKHGLWEHEAGIIKKMSGAAVSIDIAGDPILYMDKDGTMWHPDFGIAQTISAGDGSITLNARVLPGAGRWYGQKGALKFCSVSDRESVTRVIQTPERTLTTTSAVRRKAHVPGGLYIYECSATELRITAVGDFPDNTRPWWLYERADGANRCKK